MEEVSNGKGVLLQCFIVVYTIMSSPEESNSYLGGGSPHNQGISRSGSIGGHRSRLHLTSDISLDEGDVLKKISEEVCVISDIIMTS